MYSANSDFFITSLSFQLLFCNAKITSQISISFSTFLYVFIFLCWVLLYTAIITDCDLCLFNITANLLSLKFCGNKIWKYLHQNIYFIFTSKKTKCNDGLFLGICKKKMFQEKLFLAQKHCFLLKLILA